MGFGLGLGLGFGLGLVWCYGQGKFRVRVRIRVRVGFVNNYVCGYGRLWLELTLPETLTLTHNPNSQNEIVEGHN